jgi:hypothetical protein
MLKSLLKPLRGARGAGAHDLEMLSRLQEGVGLRAGWGLLLAAEPRAQIRQSAAQALEQMIKRFQSERRRQRLDSRLDGTARQQAAEQFPEPGSCHRVARQHLNEEDGKGAATTAALAAIGAPDHLPAWRLALGRVGVVAEQFAVAV